jgi:hypothetical protein
MRDSSSRGTTRTRASLALFGAVFGFGDGDDGVRADGGDRSEER